MATQKTAASDLAVGGAEEPWGDAELAEVRAELEADVARVRAELDELATDFEGLLRNPGDGAGDDQADVGNANFEREHEISLARKSAEVLRQSERALGRMDDGTYGVCESCGGPIGKLRLQAFPRATLCMTCKKKQERR
ncbi:TraR/DksA family transcriptional regulator [Dermacoccus nishinomiyaensis]|uniref:TraR/DksA family transcriptional regulator n=1 Tax=Dermacoccus TaxID=57495 RepID=UPI0003071AB7|nr:MULTISPECIES: TraR/DksA C4-type zinc finger protein [Dermacoccus]PZP02188.1 MAG: DNA-binding protein [Dermacoccus nishinomiyaensis]QQY25847.1 TraR/DksA C4-type zinc finger protein [Dermacoccus nishinomiyaensis]TCJ91405.1 TraR/DksA family transcriptional regulator [Dermacoccus sp. SAI-028]TJZ97765.1 TraR/DksA family transcriptional regulator [Dermacoccus nishinomiyaensis]STD16155.1 DnaK suppressor protein [Dermacoccus nishinomiyaensis]